MRNDQDEGMFNKVLVANRGAVAARVLRCLNEMGIRSVAVYSEVDRDLPYLELADEAYPIGSAEPRASYLNQEALIAVLRHSGADGLHPGYGFLAENAEFAARVEAEGSRFIGPRPRWLDAMGHKAKARSLMAKAGMPMGAGSGVLPPGGEAVIEAARRIGFPVLIKPALGGGGIGMLPARDEVELERAVERARALAERSFGEGELYLERLIERPRHVEFQILADDRGGVRHLFERDCSVQRRHQKVIEEAPAPTLDRAVAEGMADEVADVLRQVGYDNIGTVETLYESDAGFRFLEMNTRLQVEHAVTEEVTDIDLVAGQIRLAAGASINDVVPEGIVLSGHALEARVYAEDPKRFFPSPGPLRVFRPPVGSGIRVETGYREGAIVTPFYDPMIAKVIVRANSREEAIAALDEALGAFVIEGVKTNIPFLRQVLGHQSFQAGHVHTGLAQEVLAEKT